MAQWQTMLFAVLGIFTIAGVGALARKLDWLTEEADQSLLKLVVRVLFPAFIMDVILSNTAMRDPKNLTLPPLVGMGTVLGGMALAWLVAKLLKSKGGLHDDTQIRTFAFCVGLYNYGYVPLPLAKSIFDDNTVAVMMVHNSLGVEVIMWTLGIMLISGRLGKGWWKRLFNANTLAIVVALTLNLTGWHAHVPVPLLQAFKLLGAAAIPLSVILVGAVAADEFSRMPLRQGGRVIGLSVLLRLGILPALFLVSAMLIPATKELKQVMVLEAAMPSAVFPIVLARHYGGHAPTALRVVLGTSLISLITMTLWLSWGMQWLGMAR